MIFNKCRLLLTLLCVLLPASNPVTTQAADSADEIGGAAFWGLRPGNQLLVKSTISRTTKLTRANGPEREFKTTDQFELLYVVEDLSPDGNLFISVRIASALRETGDGDPDAASAADRRLGLLDTVRIKMIVNHDGTVDTVAPGDREALITALGGLNPAASGFLAESCSSDVLASWLSKPFLMVVSPDSPAPDHSWTRQHLISLGMLGVIRTHIEAKIDKPKDELEPETAPAGELINVTLALNGPQRFLPESLPSQLAASLPVHFSSPAASIEQLSGTATLYVPDPASKPNPNGPRPQFDSINLTTVLNGHCSVSTETGEQALQFHQTQTETWQLVSWRTGAPRMFSTDGVPIPVPNPANPN
ncbi:MAG: hypothetical protein JNL58_15445 [Planctomyces sp.]|nr:hypothetical protein [Planctomyces sp.]